MWPGNQDVIKRNPKKLKMQKLPNVLVLECGCGMNSVLLSPSGVGVSLKEAPHVSLL